ncbi:glucose-6-phosphate dehydrogenase [Candidatus Uhrbacteria bacterium]|nr:glucose-6-phosphate dehydrogenase [Candidatus Uhrbacteria bacterium]
MPPERISPPDHPIAFIVCGATGDLTQRKIYPSLYKLARQSLLPKEFFLYGIARRPLSDEAFAQNIERDVRAAVGEELDSVVLGFLTARARYISADLNDAHGYETLDREIRGHESAIGQRIERLHYLALPPLIFAAVVGHLKPDDHSRIIIEKPFGFDVKTAEALEKLVRVSFQESQIYRIDHYLGKEAIQNILTFRRKNPIFESVWSAQGVAAVHIDAFETVGMEGRGAYYDEAGALRDMVQNHLLQLVAFLAMETPEDASSSAEQAARARLLGAIRPFQGSVSLVRGAYEGFASEPGVKPDSSTETYASMVLEIGTDRWKGVPIFIRTGKRAHKKHTCATVTFRAPEGVMPNRLTFEIDPRPSITLSMNVVQPGFTRDTTSAAMHFCRNEHFSAPAVGDYERLLLAAMKGDQSLFVSKQEIRASWLAIDPFLREASTTPPERYAQTSSGPQSAATLASTFGYPWPDHSHVCRFD